jgi:hypothetical protein
VAFGDKKKFYGLQGADLVSHTTWLAEGAKEADACSTLNDAGFWRGGNSDIHGSAILTAIRRLEPMRNQSLAPRSIARDKCCSVAAPELIILIIFSIK